jgi:hypothetical protein
MRQQAKPFTVEIKKSRKTSTEPQSLFGLLDQAAARVSEGPAARLFDRPTSNGHNGHNGHDGGHNGVNGHQDLEADIARVFGTAETKAPANRILPDLTAKPVVPETSEDQPPVRRARVVRSKAPKIPKPKPLPVTMAEPVVRQEVEATPIPSIRVRRRPKDEAGLARGERWKRRLPRFAR